MSCWARGERRALPNEPDDRQLTTLGAEKYHRPDERRLTKGKQTSPADEGQVNDGIDCGEKKRHARNLDCAAGQKAAGHSPGENAASDGRDSQIARRAPGRRQVQRAASGAGDGRMVERL